MFFTLIYQVLLLYMFSLQLVHLKINRTYISFSTKADRHLLWCRNLTAVQIWILRSRATTKVSRHPQSAPSSSSPSISRLRCRPCNTLIINRTINTSRGHPEPTDMRNIIPLYKCTLTTMPRMPYELKVVALLLGFLGELFFKIIWTLRYVS